MNIKRTSLSLLVALAIGGMGNTYAQGLLSIGESDDFDEHFPFTVSIGAGVGYDSNANSSSVDPQESVYYQAGVNLGIASGSKTFSYNAGLSYSGNYYDDPGPGEDDYQHNARASFGFRYLASPRLTITNASYISYETEPNYEIGAATARRNDPYLYGYNNIGVTYAWSRRFSTVSSYTITGVDYEDGDFSNENRLTQILREEARYALSRVTSVAAEYRFEYTDYENDFNTYYAHYALAGIDHSFSRLLSGSFRVGAQFREFDNRDADTTSPYAEAALNYQAGDKTSLRYYLRYGLDANDLGSYQENETLRTGISASHAITPYLTGTIGANYIHGEFKDSPVASDFDEDTIAVNVGLDYQIARNVSLYTNYYFVNVSSGNEFREYDRHRVSVGATVTF